VRRSPNGPISTTLNNGTFISVLSTAAGENGKSWIYVARDGVPVGWVIRDYVDCQPSKIAETETSQDAPLTDCDKYAANSLDPRAKGMGIDFEKIDPKIAIPACIDALGRYPRISRFQFQLGRAYLNHKDYAKALVWFRKAADQGDAFAQNGLGVMYTNGLGVEKNYVQALAWYQKAADQGNEFSKKQIDTVNAAINLNQKPSDVAAQFRDYLAGTSDNQSTVSSATEMVQRRTAQPGVPKHAAEEKAQRSIAKVETESGHRAPFYHAPGYYPASY
jgi:tetratricopeptide (TPR) repeat protein